MKIFRKGGARFCVAKGSIYCLDPIFLDIETANNHAADPKDLRTWIVSIQVQFNKRYYLFRKPEELIDFYKGLYKKLRLKPGKFRNIVVTYIHNLSFDISYLKPYLDQLPYETGEYKGIVESPNKFLTYVKGPFEFRCSYRLSGMSLQKWSNEFNIEHKKKAGLYDYERVLYPDSELSEDDQTYDRYDILSMAECLQKQMIYHGDNVVSIPLTMTGYIRRELRKSSQKDKRYRNEYFYYPRLSADIYDICWRSFSGGFTHSNRHYNDMLLECGKIYDYTEGIKVNIKRMRHRDFKSHYPSNMNKPLPLGNPQKIYTQELGFPYYISDCLEDWPQFTTFVIIRLYGAKIRDEKISMPFMQFSKLYDQNIQHIRLDNGRVLMLDGYGIMYLDTLSLKIIDEQYELDYEIVEAWRMENKTLPPCLLNVVDKYFKGKSDKKNIVKELTKEFGKLDPKTVEADFHLQQDKKMLNASFGCMVMNPLRSEFVCDENMEFHINKDYKTLSDMQAGLNSFYSKWNNFLNYAAGCMITSYARYELYEFIKVIGYENCLYCDTDSIFYISTPEIEKKVEALNEEKHKAARFVELDNGKKEYYDCFELEPDIKAFKALRSKCYGVVTDKGLELTIAGVPARTIIGMENDGPIYLTREQELAGEEKDPIKALDHLNDEFTFHINTGVCALYIGAEGFGSDRKPKEMIIDGHKISTAGGCVIRRLEEKKISNIGKTKTNDDNYEEQISIDSLI